MKAWVEGMAEESPLYVRAKARGDGSILVFVVDAAGREVERGCILTLGLDGAVHLHPSISREVARRAGLSLRNVFNDRIKVEGLGGKVVPGYQDG